MLKQLNKSRERKISFMILLSISNFPLPTNPNIPTPIKNTNIIPTIILTSFRNKPLYPILETPISSVLTPSPNTSVSIYPPWDQLQVVISARFKGIYLSGYIFMVKWASWRTPIIYMPTSRLQRTLNNAVMTQMIFIANTNFSVFSRPSHCSCVYVYSKAPYAAYPFL